MRVDASDRLVVESDERKPKKKPDGADSGGGSNGDGAGRDSTARTGPAWRGGGRSTRVLFGVLAVLVLLLVGALVAPGFIDWNAYRGDIAAQVEEATGRELVIEGDVALRLLPTPVMAVEEVRLANASGATADDMISLKSLEIRVAAAPLLRGTIQVTSISLVEPVIELERMADGRTNWAFDAAGDTGAAGALPPLALDRFAIEDGTIVYRDAANQTLEVIENLDAEISAASLAGPFKAKGTITTRAEPLGFDLQTGTIAEGAPIPVTMALTMARAGMNARYNGSVGLGEVGVTIDGSLDASGDDLRRVVALAAGGSGPPLLAQAFEIRGAITLAEGRLAMNDVAFELGDDRGSADLTVAVDPRVEAELSMRLSRLDLDKWLETAADAVDRGEDEDAADAGDEAFSLPAQVAASLGLEVGVLHYNGNVIRDARLNADLADGVLSVAELSAAGPGDSRVRIVGRLATTDGAPNVDARVQASATDLRAVADWLDISLDPIPPNRLRSMSLTMVAAGTPDRLAFDDIALKLDQTTLTGAVTAHLGDRPGFGIALNVDRLNLDDYLGRPADGGDDGPGTAPDLDEFDANLELNIATLVYNNTQIQGVDLGLALQGGEITVNEIGVANLAGARASFDGSITGLPGLPAAKGGFALEANDLTDVVQLIGIELPFAAADLGPTIASGEVEYAAGRVGIDAELTTAGGVWKADGSVGGFGGTLDYELELDLELRDPARVAGLADISLPESIAGIGPVGLKGSAKGGTTAIGIDIVVSAAGGTAGFEGRIADLDGDVPSANLIVNGRFPDAALPLRLAGIEPDAAIASLGEALVTGTVKNADADTFDLDLKVGVGGGSVVVAGRLADMSSAPHYAGNLRVNHPDLRALLVALQPDLALPEEDIGSLAVSLSADASADIATISDLSGNLGPIRFDGAANVKFGEPRPRLRASLTLGELPLELFAAGSAETDGPRWSREELDLALLHAVDGEISLRPDVITVADHRIDEPRLKITLEDGGLVIPEFTGRLYGGSFDMTARLVDGTPARAAITVAVREADLAEALAAQGQKRFRSGVAEIDVDVAATGLSMFDMVSNLNGNGRLDVSNGVVDGIDLVDANEQIEGLSTRDDILSLLQSAGSLAGLVGGALLGGETRFAELSATFQARDGVINSSDLILIADGGAGDGRVVADLPRWTMDMEAAFALDSLPDAPVGMRVRGPLDDPGLDIDASGLRDYLLAEATRGAAEAGLLPELPGVPGGGTEDGFLPVLEGMIDDDAGGAAGLPPAARSAGPRILPGLQIPDLTGGDPPPTTPVDPDPQVQASPTPPQVVPLAAAPAVEPVPATPVAPIAEPPEPVAPAPTTVDPEPAAATPVEQAAPSPQPAPEVEPDEPAAPVQASPVPPAPTPAPPVAVTAPVEAPPVVVPAQPVPALEEEKQGIASQPLVAPAADPTPQTGGPAPVAQPAQPTGQPENQGSGGFGDLVDDIISPQTPNSLPPAQAPSTGPAPSGGLDINSILRGLGGGQN